MMKDPEKINMEINIGGEAVSLVIPFQKQELIRDVEADLNRLHDKWRRNFPEKTPRQLLAMMVYQYALYYKELILRYQEANDLADDCLEAIEKIKL